MSANDELRKFIRNAKLKNMSIDVNSLDFDAFHDLGRKQKYKDIYEANLLWEVMLIPLLKASDYENPGRKLTQTEKESFVNYMDEFTNAYPIKYYFYFALPEGYPLQDKRLTPNVQIKTIDDDLIESISKANPSRQSSGKLAQELERILAPKAPIPKKGKKYFIVDDKGLVVTGVKGLLDYSYSPYRLMGIYLALNVTVANLSYDSIATHHTNPIVYDESMKYRANFVSPDKGSLAKQLQFADKIEPQRVRVTDERGADRITPFIETDMLETERKQICNALYWYLQALNSEEINLRIVFLVSAFDSLFPQRKHSISKQKIEIRAPEKAIIVSESIADSVEYRQESIKVLEQLYDLRNDVIHGKEEIHGYRKEAFARNAQTKEIATTSEEILRRFIRERTLQFHKSILKR